MPGTSNLNFRRLIRGLNLAGAGREEIRNAAGTEATPTSPTFDGSKAFPDNVRSSRRCIGVGDQHWGEAVSSSLAFIDSVQQRQTLRHRVDERHVSTPDGTRRKT
ncbi:MAG TPA: hypothetical protein VF440_12765 [Novosphingobium sp.]